MKLNKIFATLVLSGGMIANANAYIVIDDWKIDATGVDGISGVNGTSSPISYMAFDNTFHTTIDVSGGANAAALDQGDLFNVKAYGLITGMFDDTSSTITPDLFNSTSTLGGATGWELTFVFDINGQFSSDPSGANLNTNFNHLSGTLTFYADNISGAQSGDKAATAAANPHVTDGIKVAEFSVINDVLDPNYGGVFSALLGNGGDKAIFEMTYNSGVFKDSLGNALALGSTLAFTNSDFQSNVAGSGPFGYDPDAFTCGKTLVDFCGTESGQYRTAVSVPEPASLMLLGMGLLSFGVARRRLSV